MTNYEIRARMAESALPRDDTPGENRLVVVLAVVLGMVGAMAIGIAVGLAMGAGL
jgi:hypothetical protein